MVADHGLSEHVYFRVGRDRQLQVCVADIDVVRGIGYMGDFEIVQFRWGFRVRTGGAQYIGHRGPGLESCGISFSSPVMTVIKGRATTV